jgi:hypothetical protein
VRELVFPEKINNFYKTRQRSLCFLSILCLRIQPLDTPHLLTGGGEGGYFVGMWRMKGAHVASGLIPSLFASSCLVPTSRTSTTAVAEELICKY